MVCASSAQEENNTLSGLEPLPTLSLSFSLNVFSTGIFSNTTDYNRTMSQNWRVQESPVKLMFGSQKTDTDVVVSCKQHCNLTRSQAARLSSLINKVRSFVYQSFLSKEEKITE